MTTSTDKSILRIDVYGNQSMIVWGLIPPIVFVGTSYPELLFSYWAYGAIVAVLIFPVVAPLRKWAILDQNRQVVQIVRQISKVRISAIERPFSCYKAVRVKKGVTRGTGFVVELVDSDWLTTRIKTYSNTTKNAAQKARSLCHDISTHLGIPAEVDFELKNQK